MKDAFKKRYESEPPIGVDLILYDAGAFYAGRFNGYFFVEMAIMSYPTHWAIMPKGFNFSQLTADDEPDGWTNDFYERKRKAQ